MDGSLWEGLQQMPVQSPGLWEGLAEPSPYAQYQSDQF